MTKKVPIAGPLHGMPADLRKAIGSAPLAAQTAWKDITVLAEKDWLDSYIDSKTLKPRELGRMRGHSDDNDAVIRIYQYPNAHVMHSAIEAIRGKDWFPKGSNGEQVDEIRFVDANQR